MNSENAVNTGHYIHRIKYNRRERLVGLFVFSALVLFAALFFVSSKSQHLFEPYVRYYMDVETSEGISQGSPVTLLGTEIGSISGLELAHGRKIRVALDIYKSQRDLIRTDAKVIVNRLISLGNALIEIKVGSYDAPVMPEDSTIPVEETPSLNDLVLGIARIVQSTDTSVFSEIAEMMPRLEQTIGNIDIIITQIATGHGTLGAAVFDQQVEKELKQVVTSGAEILSETEGVIDVAKQRLVELKPIITSVNRVLNDFQGATQDLPELVEELKKTIALTNTALLQVNEELHHLPGIALDVRRTLTGAEKVVEGAQDIWPLSEVIQKPENQPLIPPQPLHD